jgi:DNA-binding NtrC family response regulator/predicted hydrocarbon binding protein
LAALPAFQLANLAFQIEIGGIMRVEDLKLDELLEFRDGVIDFQGRRLVLHSTDAFAQFRKDLFEMVGAGQARRILTRFAYFWGQADAAAMRRVFKWDNVVDLVKAGPRLHALQGVARWVTKKLEMDQSTGHFEMEVAWHSSAEAEEHTAVFGHATHPACWTLAGYASGFMSFALGRDVYFVEQRCRAMGERVCTAVGKDRASWGADINPHLPYFHAADIKGKIQNLTEELRRVTRELRRSTERLITLERPPLVEVRSKAFGAVLDLATRIAPFDSSVLITGESGVGKEVVARLVHARSQRGHGPFLGINCGALPETLLDSELFGHKAGAFTGATGDHAGLFEEAAGGTIFLDEIGEISHALQVKLLRVLQEREIRRVGESRTRKIDVRILAATNRDLAEAMRRGAFREDLYYRLRVIEIAIPPLRERKEDILPLARFFVERLRAKLKMPKLRLDATVIDPLSAYPWPGNVRELENAIEHAAVLSRSGAITPELLPSNIVLGSGAPAGPARGARSLGQVEKQHIRAVLAESGGNRTRAAAVLGISPTTLWRRLKVADRS